MAVTLTTTAAEHVRRFVGDHHPRLRVGVKRTGCSGYAYTVDLVDDVTGEDSVFESNGVRIVVDPKSLELIDGTEIDYGRDGLNEGFRYDNPQVKSLCGCGESFGV